MTPIELAGWLVCAVLGFTILVQFESTRYFHVPRKRPRDSWPTLSILVNAHDDGASLRECVGSLARQDYEGELEILLLDNYSADGTTTLVEQVASTYPNVRSLRAAANGERETSYEQLVRAASGDYVLLTDATTIHDPETASATVSHTIENETEAVLVRPGLILSSPIEALLIPLLPFFDMTVPGIRVPLPKGQLLLVVRSVLDEILATGSGSGVPELVERTRDERVRLEILDGRFLIRSRISPSGSEVQAGFTQALHTSIGHSPPKAVGAALLLIVLFVVPPIAAITTASFAWIAATIFGLFLRLRTAARSGEHPGLTLLHPIAIAVAAGLLLRWTLVSRAESSGSGDHHLK